MDAFPLHRHGRDGRDSRCRTCRAHWSREYNAVYRDKRRERWLKNSYGIDLFEFDALWESQGRCCAICRKSSNFSPKTVPVDLPHVDHDHETGKVRGLLCQFCNTALGLFQDDPGILARAIVYLEETKSNN